VSGVTVHLISALLDLLECLLSLSKSLSELSVLLLHDLESVVNVLLNKFVVQFTQFLGCFLQLTVQFFDSESEIVNLSDDLVTVKAIEVLVCVQIKRALEEFLMLLLVFFEALQLSLKAIDIFFDLSLIGNSSLKGFVSLLEVSEVFLELSQSLAELVNFILSSGDVTWDAAVIHLFVDIVDSALNIKSLV